MPYMEEESLNWNFKKSVYNATANNGNTSAASPPGPADRDIKGLYCPTRRSAFRPTIDDRTGIMPATTWAGGGTDYGGCAGRHCVFDLTTAGYPSLGGTVTFTNNYYPPPFTSGSSALARPDLSDKDESKRWGILGRINQSTSPAEIRDGLSCTIMTGELQRIIKSAAAGPFSGVVGPKISHDGWAVGGCATLFSTGCMFDPGATSLGAGYVATGGKLINNTNVMSPGSEHSGGANFGMGDGSVRFIADTANPRIFALMGSMDDGVALDIGEL